MAKRKSLPSSESSAASINTKPTSTYLPSPPTTPLPVKPRKRKTPAPEAPRFAATELQPVLSDESTIPKKKRKVLKAAAAVATETPVIAEDDKPRKWKRKAHSETSAVDASSNIVPETVVEKPVRKRKSRALLSENTALPDSQIPLPDVVVEVAIPKRRSRRTKFSATTTITSTTEVIATDAVPATPVAKRGRKKKVVTSPYFAVPEITFDWEAAAAGSPATSVVHLDVHKPRYIPPRSPENLIQESLYTNPWALLIATIFLNKTTGRKAKPKLWEFFQKWPSPEACAAANQADILPIFSDLGLQNQRSARVIKFSQAFIDNPHFTTPRELPGIGVYGEDSWRLFCGRVGDTAWMEGMPEIADKELAKYVAWRREMYKKGLESVGQVEKGGVEQVVESVIEGGNGLVVEKVADVFAKGGEDDRDVSAEVEGVSGVEQFVEAVGESEVKEVMEIAEDAIAAATGEEGTSASVEVHKRSRVRKSASKKKGKKKDSKHDAGKDKKVPKKASKKCSKRSCTAETVLLVFRCADNVGLGI
ncbi:Methyl-CpG-binding domain protein 4 [Rhizophlyctis rosea]|nr:Methyl-CpG-binding domain protein 4 [Rhizophlyctis rosea]